MYCATGNGTKCNDFGKFNYLTEFEHEKSSQIALAA